MRKLFTGLVVLGVIGAGIIYAIGTGRFGSARDAGEIVAKSPRSAETQRTREGTQTDARDALEVASQKQILFGDLHVHTTFSFDAFLMSLPMLNGEGARPPANACDFARYCSALDFWSINDHAERLLPQHWAETKESIRQCNAAAGDPNDPDLVSFLGWEWTQVGTTPDNHYGHKNVILLDTEEDKVPQRPIASAPPGGRENLLTPPSVINLAFLGIFAPAGRRQDYLDFAAYMTKRAAMSLCPKGVDVRTLPLDCLEQTATPDILYAKLRQWGFPAKVIPHGTSWGFYTPPGSSWDKQLTSAQNDPELQTLFEVYSGHGNAEEYRSWRATRFDDAGKPYCPKPEGGYLSSCQRAGVLIRERCVSAGETADVCDMRATEARQRYVDAGISGFRTVPGSRPEDWLNSGQCADCFIPAFNYRPANSAQYTLAITNFDEDEPKRARFGFVAASDIHTARPGTGYKEFDRENMTEAGGPPYPGLPLDSSADQIGDPMATRALTAEEAVEGLSIVQSVEIERLGSFWATGGLTAVHTTSRRRGDIWDAMDRRETYGTSGDRILLWFDVENTPQGPMPMGSQVQMGKAPSFTVRAAGAFKQKPGCPDNATSALGADVIADLCHNECYNPSDTRKKITHIDIIRIHPQVEPGEKVDKLIEDPWRRFACSDTGEGCVVRFSDDDFTRTRRDTVYYARAVQEPSDAVNGDNLRCAYDEEGVCIKVNPCFDDYRTEEGDDCLAPVAERAWSSPIFVDYAR